MANVDVQKLASVLNLDERRIQQLVHEGMPRAARGQYDPVKCMLWYIRYLQKALERKAVPTLEGGFVGEREERIRLLRADADLRELALAKDRALYVALPDVEATLTELAVTTTARVMAIPPQLAPMLVGERSRLMIQAKIEKACKEALAFLAKVGRDGNQNTPKRAG
jgi:phage terminase Nu1 subunit (DNA packaging protein)